MSPGYSVPSTHLILGHRSRLQCHKVQKHISVEGDRVAGVNLHFIEWQQSSYSVLLVNICIQTLFHQQSW